MRAKMGVATLSVLCLTLLIGSKDVRADGGMLRFHGRRADRVISVFTTPNPLCVGLADVSVLVQQTESGRVTTDFSVKVLAYPLDRPDSRISAAATNEAATNKLFRAAMLELHRPGRWHVDVIVEGLSPNPPIEFEMEVADATVPWLEFSLWICWPLLPIALYAIQQFRQSRVFVGPPSSATRNFNEPMAGSIPRESDLQTSGGSAPDAGNPRK
jgi:hypothetical protein